MRRSVIAALTSHHMQRRSLSASFRVHTGLLPILDIHSHAVPALGSSPCRRSIANIRQVDGVPTISVQDARKDLSAFQYVVDVREPDEVKHGMIDGAYHIPLGQVVRDMGQPVVQQIKGKPVLVYCRSGKRSAMAVTRQNSAALQLSTAVSVPLLSHRPSR
jgi:rhodanese-related sulfurtransferase